MRVLYFGTYERTYPRNAQVISCLRGAGVEVEERHVSVWEGREHKWAAGPAAALRLLVGEARLLKRPEPGFDALIVGYPGHLDLPAARFAARGKPVVFNPLVSLADTLVDDRARFRRGSLPARALTAVDRRALQAADLVVADTEANADDLTRRGRIPHRKVAVCFVGAEELFTALEHALGVGNNQTTPDGMFTLQRVKCLAACSRAPLLQANLDFHYDLNPDKVDALLTDLRNRAASGEELSISGRFATT